MAKRRSRKRATNQTGSQGDLFEVLDRTAEARARMHALLTTETCSPATWRGWAAVPPGTFLARAVTVFDTETDIPLEIPFAAALTATAAELTRRGITARIADATVRPRTWMVLLAESGGGKTTATDYVLDAVGAEQRIRDPVSVPAMIESIDEADLPLWYKDEWGLWLKSLETGMLQGMKPYLLELYSGRTIEWRRAGRDGEDRSLRLAANRAAVSFLGTTVGSTLYKHMSPESLLDGFAARFSFMYADPDPARPPEDFPIYRHERHAPRLAQEWANMWSEWDDTNNLVLEASPEAEEAFREGFAVFARRRDLDRAFLRRLMWGSLSYAMVYQANLGAPNGTLSNAAIEWAGRLTGLMTRDTLRLLKDLGYGEFARTVAAGLRYVERFRAKHGEDPARRDLISGVLGIRNAAEAAAILEMAQEQP